MNCSINCLSCIAMSRGFLVHHNLRYPVKPLFRTMLQPKNTAFRQRSYTNAVEDEYRQAISALNSLQSNKRALADARMVQHATDNMPMMYHYLEKIGIELQTLEKKLSVIHVSGTKGKGSTCAYCEAILRHYGYKTGFFSSPHLCSVRERLRINGEPLSKRKFADYFRSVHEKLKPNEKSVDSSMPPYFMFLTVLMFKVFLEENVDVAIVEVGIGGEYDCTNILKNTAVVGISSLGYDHVRILGSSIEEIAWQKAGIMKPTSVVVTAADQPEAALRVLQSRAAEKGRTLYVAPDLSEYQSDGEIVLGIGGPVQRLNASLALQLTNAWMNPQHYPQEEPTSKKAAAFTISKEMSTGLRTCSWPGRTQILHHSAQLSYYLDGAHTDESIRYCLRWFGQTAAALTSSRMKQVLVFNMIGDRDTRKLLKLFLPHPFDTVCFCTNRMEVSAGKVDSSGDNWAHPSNDEEKRAEENRNHWRELNPNADEHNTKLMSSVSEVHEFLQKLAREQHVQVLVTGSLHLVGAFLGVLGSDDEDFPIRSRSRR